LKTKIEIEKTRMPLMYKIRRPCHERREERGARSGLKTFTPTPSVPSIIVFKRWLKLQE
jgi:hypothetical protein